MNAVSGILKTEALLDRDEGPGSYFLSIQATDSAGEYSLSNVTEVSANGLYTPLTEIISLQIEVHLIDQNDNCPNFIQPTFSGQVSSTN